MNRRFAAIVFSFVLTITLFSGCRAKPTQPLTDVSSQTDVSSHTEASSTEETDDDIVVYGETYSDLLSVSAYLYEWEELPPNYITKGEAEKLGWVSS